jgi:hypothetical protein
METMIELAEAPTKSLFDMRRLVPRTEKEYDALVSLLDMVLDSGGRYEENSLSELAYALGLVLKDYEDVYYPDKDFS